ncbi:MAG: hypothetical protein M3R04_02055 [bacterium]|nr:hypothetical protein [bacterium]
MLLVVVIATSLFLTFRKEGSKHPLTIPPDVFQIGSLQLPERSKIVEHTGMGTNAETIAFSHDGNWEDVLSTLEAQLLAAGFVNEAKSPAGAIYTRGSRYELAIFPELDKPSTFVLMSMSFSKDEAEEIAALRERTNENEIRAELRNLIRTIHAAQNSYFKATGTYGSLELLCNSPSKVNPLLPGKFEQGLLGDGTTIIIDLGDGTYIAKASRGELSCWVDQSGMIQETSR